MPTNYYWQPQFFSPSGIPEVLLFSVISVVVLERVELISYRFLEVPIYCWLVLWLKMFLKPVWEGKIHGVTKIGIFRPFFCVNMLGKSTNYSAGTRPLCSTF